MSSSNASSFFIWVAPQQVVSGGFSTWNYRLQEVILWLFNVWHQVNVAVKCHDKNRLVWIFPRVWVAQFIQQTIRLDSKGYNLKRNAALNFKHLVFVMIPAKWFHVLILAWRVPIVTFLCGGLTWEITGQRGFLRRAGGLMGWAAYQLQMADWGL